MSDISIPIARPQMGAEEEAAVLEVLRSGVLAQGPRVRAFEEAFAAAVGARYAIATSSGTTALFVALAASGITTGDEVITSPFTFIASANAIAHVGARPVFADVDDTLNLDPSAAEQRIGPRTRALMPIHIHGNPCDIQTFVQLAARHNLVLLQDACQAVGATVDGLGLGTFGTAAYSFYATKNITTGEGGMVTTNDPEVAERCASLRHQAYSSSAPYVHEAIGYNFRMTELQAAIGLCQVAKLQAVTDQRRQNAAYFDRAISNPRFVRPRIAQGHSHVYHQYVLRLASDAGLQRDHVVDALHSAGIGAAIHYPLPVHRQPPYLAAGDSPCPQAERAASDLFSIPVHPGVSQGEREWIAQTLNSLQ